MKRVCVALFLFVSHLLPAWAQAVVETSATNGVDQTALNNNAAAATAAAAAAGRPVAPTPDFLEHLVDRILQLFDVRTSGNTWQHYAIAAAILILFYLLRRVVTTWIFGILKKFAERTTTTLDDKLFPALEAPVATFIALFGLFAALKVLKLDPSADRALGYGSTIAFSLTLFWFLLRAFNAVLDHLHEVALEKKSGVAAFMPWIKKALVTIFVIFGVLMTAQSLGADVKAFLAGLGIGGLAFALAAQDTIANLFGSVVVAIDQPFRNGDNVQIGSHTGQVEDIGLRSTKLRRPDKSLVIIPNKTVAAEAVINLSKFTQRRVEQVIGFTYDATPEQLDGIVEKFRSLILAEAEVDPASVMVFFRDFNASSLDLWVVYIAKDPDFQKHMRLRQRLNLAFMRAATEHGLSFAFPTQTLELGGTAAKILGGRASLAPSAPAKS